MVRESAFSRPDRRPMLWLFSFLLLAAALLSARPAKPQELDAATLEDLVAPVALYPDDVLGVILPASTFPLDIVRAARFLEDLESDPSLVPDPEWDDSVVALLNYPEVVYLMDENIDWTWELGEAVLTDQAAVLAAAQDFRARALAAGNLQSDDRQIVTASAGSIAIKPANPEVIYIPVYEPREVVVYHSAPIWRYYPVAYPVYYYPYPAGYWFDFGFFWGVTSYFSIGWHSHYVHVHHHTHYAHPYYAHSYYSYAPYYPRSHVNITVAVNNYDHVWQPSPRRGSRPQTVTVEGRTSAMRTTRTATVESQAGGAPRASSQRMSSSSTGSSARSPSAATRSLTAPQQSASGQNSTRPSTSRQTSPRASSGGAPATQSTRMASQAAAGTAAAQRNAPARTTVTTEQPTRRSTTAPASSASTTRMAPQSSTRSQSQSSTRPPPQASTQRSQSSSQPSMGGSTRSGSSSTPRTQGTSRSGGDRASPSPTRQSQR